MPVAGFNPDMVSTFMIFGSTPPRADSEALLDDPAPLDQWLGVSSH